MSDISKKRLIEIDFLRGVAILLVLFHHSDLNFVLSKVGWIGVDLFFVLSGFLVGGLLYKEVITTGHLQPGRFLIRRGFKIYPSFYFFIFITIVVKLFYISRGTTEQEFTWYQIVSELFFVQNYFGNLWNHTWSLAVEEHFYLLLTLLFTLAVKFKWIASRKSVRIFILVIMGLCLLLRIAVVSTGDISLSRNYFPTHLRADSLFFGVLLADLYHYERKRFIDFFNSYKAMLAILAGLFLLPLFLFSRMSVFINSIGFTLFYLSFGIILSLFLTTNITRFFKGAVLQGILKIVGTIGYYSYSIYLWHMFVSSFFISFITNSIVGHVLPTGMAFTVYFSVSIITGIVFAKLVELPALKIREKFFPA